MFPVGGKYFYLPSECSVFDGNADPEPAGTPVLFFSCSDMVILCFLSGFPVARKEFGVYNGPVWSEIPRLRE